MSPSAAHHKLGGVARLASKTIAASSANTTTNAVGVHVHRASDFELLEPRPRQVLSSAAAIGQQAA